MGLGITEVMVLLVFPMFILWVIAVFDVLKNDFNGNDKLIWFLAVTFVPLIGLIAYFIIGRKQKIKKTQP